MQLDQQTNRQTDRKLVKEAVAYKRTIWHIRSGHMHVVRAKKGERCKSSVTVYGADGWV